MKTPLLLIHGEDDNNSGTYPMQSERYFNALKGLELQLDLLCFQRKAMGTPQKKVFIMFFGEQDQWLEKYVKNK